MPFHCVIESKTAGGNPPVPVPLAPAAAGTRANWRTSKTRNVVLRQHARAMAHRAGPVMPQLRKYKPVSRVLYAKAATLLAKSRYCKGLDGNCDAGSGGGGGGGGGDGDGDGAPSVLLVGGCRNDNKAANRGKLTARPGDGPTTMTTTMTTTKCHWHWPILAPRRPSIQRPTFHNSNPIVANPDFVYTAPPRHP
eukprot:scaffold7729_cov172-Amphora_coffeaeformis.AAC.5